MIERGLPTGRAPGFLPLCCGGLLDHSSKRKKVFAGSGRWRKRLLIGVELLFLPDELEDVLLLVEFAPGEAVLVAIECLFFVADDDEAAGVVLSISALVVCCPVLMLGKVLPPVVKAVDDVDGLALF